MHARGIGERALSRVRGGQPEQLPVVLELRDIAWLAPRPGAGAFYERFSARWLWRTAPAEQGPRAQVQNREVT